MSISIAWLFFFLALCLEPSLGVYELHTSTLYTCTLFPQTWDLLLITYNGFVEFCKDFLQRHPGYCVSPLRLNGSAVESIFSSLKYLAGGHLASTNYSAVLSALQTQREAATNPHSEPGYRTEALVTGTSSIK